MKGEHCTEETRTNDAVFWKLNQIKIALQNANAIITMLLYASQTRREYPDISPSPS